MGRLDGCRRKNDDGGCGERSASEFGRSRNVQTDLQRAARGPLAAVIDVRDGQSSLSYGWLLLAASVGPHHGRCGLRPGAGAVYRCEIAVVLASVAQNCFLIE